MNKAATSTALGSSKPVSTEGDAVTLTATVTVTAPGAGTPSGTVTFKDGATTLGTGPLGSGGTATFNTSSFATGAHAITASYGADDSFQASTGQLAQYVNTNLGNYPKLSTGAYDLGRVNFTGAYFVNAPLGGASLVRGNFIAAVFTGADLTGANMTLSNFTGADFTRANFTGANMSDSNFKDANFTNANLSGANLTGANLLDATGLKTATLTNVIWSKTTCPDGSVTAKTGGACLGHLR